MHIGTNHGSLSDHIMNRYGDTPREMVESALEFARICPQNDYHDPTILSADKYGSLLCDGLRDGIWSDASYGIEFLCYLSFNILHSARVRIFKTYFISCPRCGRTLFDIQDVSKWIRSGTSYLLGVKIAIMGCIVNGLGKMADANFEYGGSKLGMIDL